MISALPSDFNGRRETQADRRQLAWPYVGKVTSLRPHQLRPVQVQRVRLLGQPAWSARVSKEASRSRSLNNRRQSRDMPVSGRQRANAPGHPRR
jgi:hypothetical protein